MIGIQPPNNMLMAVATAAPTSPQEKTAINKASNIILVMPHISVTIRPSCGFEMVIKKL